MENNYKNIEMAFEKGNVFFDEDIDKIINHIKDENHYLKLSKRKNLEYHKKIISRLFIMYNVINKKDFQELIEDKLQFNHKFTEESFIQSAIELTVNSYFAEKYKHSFKYEPKLTEKSKKNVECQIETDNFKYNIEVKCPVFKKKEDNKNSGGLLLNVYGRHPDRENLINELKQTLIESSKEIDGVEKPVTAQKHFGLNLHDFLVSAHEKFNDTSEDNEINVLFVGTDAQMFEWIGHLWGYEGYFTTKPHVDPKTYNNLDIIVLGNYYHTQYQFWEKTHLKPENLSRHFNVYYVNPHRKKNKEKGILNFSNLITHNCKELNNFSQKYIKSDSTGDLWVEKLFIIARYQEEVLKPLGINLF
jgi:hypothetical protein